MSAPNDRPPRKAALFSGHMIDAPGRARRRAFRRTRSRSPPAPSPRRSPTSISGRAISAICGGACGGDLLFAEAALARSARLELYIPFDEPTFLEKSVDFAGDDWRARYFAAKARATLHVLPVERGPTPAGEDPYERNNLWMLEAASRFGPDKVDFVCLWNGERGDGPGGAQHMMEAVQESRRPGASGSTPGSCGTDGGLRPLAL